MRWCSHYSPDTGARVRGTHVDPYFKIGDNLRRQLLLRRHLQIVVFVLDRFDQFALLRMAGHHRWRTRFTPAQQAGGRIDLQFPFKLLGIGTVARIAFVDQHRANLRFKKFDPFTIGRLGGAQGHAERITGYRHDAQNPTAGANGECSVNSSHRRYYGVQVKMLCRFSDPLPPGTPGGRVRVRGFSPHFPASGQRQHPRNAPTSLPSSGVPPGAQPTTYSLNAA